MHDVVRGSVWTAYSMHYDIDGNTPVITNDLFHMLHCGFSWHLRRMTTMLPISGSSLVKLLDPIEHSFPWETVVTIHGTHFTMHFFCGQSFGAQNCTTTSCSACVHSCNTPAIVLWLPLTDHVPKQSDTTSTTSIHMLPSADKNECIMYKWYQGNRHSWLIYWLVLIYS